MPNDPPRELVSWLATTLGSDNFIVQPLVPEASTRRFYRLVGAHEGTHIAIHSSPATENNQQFVALGDLFRRQGVPVPAIYAYETKRGFLLVEDFGHVEFLAAYVDSARRAFVVPLALDALVAIQRTHDSCIPPYTRTRLLDELGIFSDWCCDKLLGRDIAPLNAVAESLIAEIDLQPKVTVHRDYHSRNLLLHGDQLGIVDFQDALVGPCVYDLASLFYDCYFEHDFNDIEHWTDQMRDRLRANDLPCIEPRSAFVRAIEVTAIQRMLKAVGIFCRLWLVQRKETHLRYVMPVLTRAIELTQRNELTPLADWLAMDIAPGLDTAMQRLLP